MTPHRNTPPSRSTALALPWRKAQRNHFRLLPHVGAVILGHACCPMAYAEGDDWNLDRVQVHEAHRRGKTGAGARIGIIDTGLFANDPAFTGRIDPRSANFGDGDAGAYQAVDRQETHGSMVAAIAAAGGRNGDVRGVAPGAAILHLRALEVGGEDRGWEGPTARAIRHAADVGAHVINGSYGPLSISEKYLVDLSTGQRIANKNYFEQSGQYLFLNPVTGRPDEDDFAAIDHAAAKDVLMVFSAGNEYGDQPRASRHPTGNALLPLIARANHGSGVYRFIDLDEYAVNGIDMEDVQRESDMALMDGADPRLARVDYAHLKRTIIAVVATDRDNHIASYSNRCGDAWQWCIAAPGGDVEPGPEDKKEIAAAGDKGGGDTAYIDARNGGKGKTGPPGFRTVGPNGRRLVQAVGTSGAAPHVAGAAAIVRAEFPFLTAGQAQEVILTTADNRGHLGDRGIYGHGLLDVDRASRGPGEFGAEGYDRLFDLDTKGDDGTFSNDIKGTGGLVKRGAGRLALSGANTYSGATIVVGGTLHVSGSIAASDVSVQQGAWLTGTGVVGNTVSNGIVALGGSVAPGDSVAPDGSVTPEGSGAPNDSGAPDASGARRASVGGRGVASATTRAATGASLSVAGHFIQLPQGVIRSTVAGDGTLARLAVAGKAEIRGGTLQVAGITTAALGKPLTLIDARQGVTGNFERVQSDSLFASLTSFAQGRRLQVAVGLDPRGFGIVARNANQRSVGKAVDPLPASNPVFERLFNTYDANAARGSLIRLAGDIHPSVTGMLAEQQAQTRATLLGQARSAGDGTRGMAGAAGTVNTVRTVRTVSTPGMPGMPGMPGTAGTAGANGKNGDVRVWGEYLNSRGNLSSDGNASGLRRRSDGLIFGADTAVSANSVSMSNSASSANSDSSASLAPTRLGGAVSFGSTTAHTRGLGAGQKADISSVSLSGYGSTQAGAVHLRYGASLGSSEVKTRRDTGFGTAKARYKAGTAQIFGEAGLPFSMPFSFGDATVEPYVGAACDRARTQGFKESGADAASLSGKRSTQGNISSSLGVRANHAWDLGRRGRVSVHAQLGWLHAYGNITPATRMRLTDSAAFTTQGLPRNRDALLVSAATTWNFSRRGAIDLAYGGAFGGRARDHTVRATAGWRF